MSTFCQRFGKRNPATSAVRSKCSISDDGLKCVLEFSFSNEVMAITGWQKGILLDVDRVGDSLQFFPSGSGRTLHGQPGTVKFGFSRSKEVEIKEFFGFDIFLQNFWEFYTVNGDRLEVKLADLNRPDLN